MNFTKSIKNFIFLLKSFLSLTETLLCSIYLLVLEMLTNLYNKTRQSYMFPIAGQTARPIGLIFFGHSWVAGG